MVQLSNRRILIGGKPVLIFSGEVHYFRLQRSEWVDRIVKAKDLGCNAIASYIPWLIHEWKRGEIRVQEVADFIDLCHSHGLWFIARPGPFIMAEMKNEGIPYWVYQDVPEAIPVTWNGEKGRSKTLDYLAPRFLDAAQSWYAGIMPVLASRLISKGGPVIAVQLDNEIGMLSWVNNQPDLTDHLIQDFEAWQGIETNRDYRRPEPAWSQEFCNKLGEYERHRIATYVAKLRSFAEAHGVRNIPFIVNIHGCGGGKGTAFPIGIHQLFESYTQSAGYLSGSDHYLGELTRENAADLYLVNAWMASVHRPEQPLSSVEFEAGTGDYGENGIRQSSASAEFKVRLSLAQGNRLLNYYLLAGGKNPPLPEKVGDGNNRAAFTGERHGFAAPISPEGNLDQTYFGLKRTTQVALAVADKLADMDEDHDNLALGFNLDYYKTAYRYPGPMTEFVEHLEWVRRPLETLTRAMLFNGYRFPAIDLLHRPLDPKGTPVLVFASSRFLGQATQVKLADYVEAGGHLLLYGELPLMDMDGSDNQQLALRLGIKPVRFYEAGPYYYLSVVPTGKPEVRVSRAQSLEGEGEVLCRILHTNEPCGLTRSVGKGKVTVLTGDGPCHLPFFRNLLSDLGATPELGGPFDGCLVTSLSNIAGERFLNLINLDQEPKTLLGDVTLGPKEAKLLPVGVTWKGVEVVRSTVEIVQRNAEFLAFAPVSRPESITIKSLSALRIEGGKVVRAGSTYEIRVDHGDVKVYFPSLA
jgi:beta-galactosidase